MKVKDFLIDAILFFSLFYLTLSTPIFITVFSHKWYESYYDYNWTDDVISFEAYSSATGNIIGYLSFREPLEDAFSQEERVHYREVRNLLIGTFSVLIMCLGIIIFTVKKRLKQLKRFTVANIVLLLLISTLIMINFTFFWDRIFHPFLFSNLYWIMTPDQISYYLFPLKFFVRTVQFVIFASIIENIFIFTYVIVKDRRLI